MEFCNINMTSNKEIIKKASSRVYEQLGYGLSEKAYQVALAAELSEIYLNIQTEYHISQYYTTTKGKKVQIADLRIDILIEDNIILELKSVGTKLEKTDKKTGELKIEEIKKIVQYKQCDRYKILMNINEGYLINFGEKGLDFIEV